jgi:hypothetical protein
MYVVVLILQVSGFKAVIGEGSSPEAVYLEPRPKQYERCSVALSYPRGRWLQCWGSRRTTGS